jgi:hypothetical protein
MAAKNEKPSYVRAMLLHPTNVSAFFGSLTAAAILSIPFGLGVGALPLIAFAAADGIASMFIPSSPKFRARVDKKIRDEARHDARSHLVTEIQRRVHSNDRGWNGYRRIIEIVTSLKSAARLRDTSLSASDIERLEDAAISYLGLWLAKLVVEERRKAIDLDDILDKITDVDVQIETVETDDERRRLQKARGDLDRIRQRRQALDSRATAVDAAVLAMVDTFEEVYQQVVTSPTSVEVTRHLQEAVERLQLEEGLDLAVEEELGDLYRIRRPVAQAAKVM